MILLSRASNKYLSLALVNEKQIVLYCALIALPLLEQQGTPSLQGKKSPPWGPEMECTSMLETISQKQLKHFYDLRIVGASRMDRLQSVRWLLFYYSPTGFSLKMRRTVWKVWCSSCTGATRVFINGKVNSPGVQFAQNSMLRMIKSLILLSVRH